MGDLVWPQWRYPESFVLISLLEVCQEWGSFMRVLGGCWGFLTGDLKDWVIVDVMDVLSRLQWWDPENFLLILRCPCPNYHLHPNCQARQVLKSTVSLSPLSTLSTLSLSLPHKPFTLPNSCHCCQPSNLSSIILLLHVISIHIIIIIIVIVIVIVTKLEGIWLDKSNTHTSLRMDVDFIPLLC